MRELASFVLRIYLRIPVMSEPRAGEKEEGARSEVDDNPPIKKLSPLQEQIIDQVEVKLTSCQYAALLKSLSAPSISFTSETAISKETSSCSKPQPLMLMAVSYIPLCMHTCSPCSVI